MKQEDVFDPKTAEILTTALNKMDTEMLAVYGEEQMLLIKKYALLFSAVNIVPNIATMLDGELTVDTSTINSADDYIEVLRQVLVPVAKIIGLTALKNIDEE